MVKTWSTQYEDEKRTTFRGKKPLGRIILKLILLK
jgi:hypothetical protein